MERVNLPDLKSSTEMQPTFDVTSESRRKNLIAKHIRRMAISAHQPVPEPDRMFLLIEDAYRLWREMSDAEISAAVDEAIREAGAFMATAGLVAKCYAKRTVRTLELASPRSSSTIEAAKEFDAWWESLTPEQQEAEQALHKQTFREMRMKALGHVTEGAE